MRFVSIIPLCILAAITYGIIHDQITARICVEYFTIGHPPVFATDDPTLLGLGWGIIATWWVGLLLGISLACAARIGSRPKLTASQLIRPLTIMLLAVAALALIAGITGYIAASRHWIWLIEPLASRVPPDNHIAFLTTLWAHSASYLAGILGGIGACIWAVIRRGRMATPQHVDSPL